MIEIIFKDRKLNIAKLLSFGFTEQIENYVYSADLIGGQLKLIVTISQDGKVYTKVIDNSNNEEYVLHRVPGSSGSFVGQVKAEYEEMLEEISVKCFEPDIFKNVDTKKVIAYASDTYGDEPEYLWQKFPNNAVLRRKDTKTWYAALLTVEKKKLGIDAEGTVEILDLRVRQEELETLIDNKRYFPGYHMNKKHWYTICLDGSIPFDEICRRIDESYILAKK